MSEAARRPLAPGGPDGGSGAGPERPVAGPAVLLMGPTAVGKTDLAVELVSRLPLSIVSVDSAMVYRRMDIGTGKPGPETLRRAPHRLVDIREPHQPYSAARFAADAKRAIASIQAAGKVPLLVGGTGLYFRALCEGLADLPPADPGVRARLSDEARQVGWAALHRRLADVDPRAAARIHPNDPQRIQRALEVHLVSGRAMTEHIEAARTRRLDMVTHTVILEPAERGWLHERIARRFEHMLARGLVDEVAALRDDPRLCLDLPALRAVGYRQVWQHLDGELDREAMAERAVHATRQLAKRQLTWLRATGPAHRVPCGEGAPAAVLRRVHDLVASALAGG